MRRGFSAATLRCRCTDARIYIVSPVGHTVEKNEVVTVSHRGPEWLYWIWFFNASGNADLVPQHFNFEVLPDSATGYSPALSPPTPASDPPSETLSTDYFSFVERKPRRSR